MKPIPFNEIDFDAFEVNEIPALFTCLRVDRNTIPAGFHAYDIRGGGEDEFQTIEPHVLVDHTGTIIVKQEMQFGEDQFVRIEEYGFTGDEPNLEAM